MRRAVISLLLLTLVGCADDRIELARGPLGPAAYRIAISVDGVEAVQDEVSARLRVDRRPDGAQFTLSIGRREPVRATLVRSREGRLELDRVRGGEPGNVGEADLASLVGQLDPPLPPGPVRLREEWSETRRISTAALAATLRSNLRIVRFRRIDGLDAAELEGSIAGDLRTITGANAFEGPVEGRTTIAWALRAGRVVASHTRLVWETKNAGRVVLEADVRPD